MNILFIAAECAPYVKVGGLGDVVGALPTALHKLGHDVRVFLPHYGAINDENFGILSCEQFEMTWNDDEVMVEVSCVEKGGVLHFLLRGWPLFAAEDPLIYYSDEGMDVGRFLFLTAATLEYVKQLAETDSWKPDVYHAHDWHTSYLPYLLRRVYADHPALGQSPSVFTIHNLRYQGWGANWHLDRAGIPPVDHGLLQAMSREDNSMAIGLAYSTFLSTVSPQYVQEIMEETGGFGLEDLLHARQSRLVGILNGIDTERWDPSQSDALIQPFDIDTLDRKEHNKTGLQAELGLPRRADVPLIGVVMRLVEQKGPDIVVDAMRELLPSMDAQFVLLGSGQLEYEEAARELGLDFPAKAAIRLTFDEQLAERIYAASDLFLMPSMFEPCGIGQMLAMRYGSLPVVHAVGGLVDTVSPNVGWLFEGFHPGVLARTTRQAIETYNNSPEEFTERVRRAMDLDYSWEQSARQYIDMYNEAISVKQQYV